MPLYEFLCKSCRKEVSLTLTLKEREARNFTCPHCGGRALEPLLTGFFAKTSKKS